MANKYSTIIWDWNGTLLNDVKLCVEIVNKILVNHNDSQLNTESYKNVFGFPITEYYGKIGIDFEIESFENITKRFISDYQADVVNCQLQKNATEILDIYKTKGVCQYILTAAHKENVISLLNHFELRDFFKQVEGLDNHRAESKISIGLQLIENNNIDKETTVLIGDTIHDFEVANELGVECILIANGHQSKDRLIEKTKNKIPVLDEIGQLPELI